MTKAILVLNEMPKRCMECPFAYEYEQMYFCKTLQKIIGTKKDECPLKPIPKEEEIDENYKFTRWDDDCDMAYNCGYNTCLEDIFGGAE